MAKHALFLAIAFASGACMALLWSSKPPQPLSGATANHAPTQQAPLIATTTTTTTAQAEHQPLKLAFADIARLTGDFEQSAALYRLMEDKDPDAISALLDQAALVLQGGDLAAASAILYGRLAELAPERALQRVLTSRDMAQRSWLHAVFHAWARVDLNSAIERAAALTSPHKQIAGRALLRSRDNLSAAEQQQIAADLGVRLPAQNSGDFATAWQQALQHAQPRLRLQHLQGLAVAWAAVDAAAAMQATASATGRNRQSLQTLVAQQWIEQDPDAALDWLLAQPHSAQQQQLVQQLFARLAAVNLPDAQQRATQLSGNRQNHAMLGILAPLAAVNPDAANRWLAELKSPRLRRNAVRTTIMKLMDYPDDVAERWIETLPATDADMANRTLTSMLVAMDPARAAQKIARMDDPQHRRQQAQNLVQNWAEQDTAATAAWIAKQPAAERAQLHQALVTRWYRWDPDGATSYVDRLTDPVHQDQARVGLISGAPGFEESRRIYHQISDPTLKQQAARYLYQQLKQIDEADAQRFRDEAGI